MDQFLSMSATAQGREIAAGRLDPRALTEAYLDAAAAHPDGARIYARLAPERARAEALAAAGRARLGLRRGPLDGVCLSWKDLYDSAGLGTEAGSRLLAGRVPDRDARVLAQATAAGTICLGKTHMTELAFSGLGLNPMTATPPNRHDPGLAPGGSSSGAALSVAFGLAAAAVGSDTGGSIRIPAAWNDLVGFKPTHGRLSLEGVVPLCKRFDTVGPIARTVEDCAAVVASLEGSAMPDLRRATLAGTRILVPEGFALSEVRAPQMQGFETALDRLVAAGAQIVRRPVEVVDPAMALSGVLFAPEAYGNWAAVIETAPEKMYPLILERFRGGAGVSAAEYVAGWNALARHRAAFAAEAAAFDAVAIPTSPIGPPDAARLLSESAYFETENLLALRNTRVGNIFGLCALTLPTATRFAGIMLMGLPGADTRLLRLGMAAETALG